MSTSVLQRFAALRDCGLLQVVSSSKCHSSKCRL